jgi:hypothetical protein
MFAQLNLKSITVLREEAKKYDLVLWQAVVLIGSFFSGLGILLVLQELLPFEYHSYKGTIGFAALHLYPEQRESFLYLLTLLIVPLITFAGYLLWFTLTAFQQKFCSITLLENLKLTAFSYLIWFLVPLLFYAPYRNEEFSLSPIVLTLGFAFMGINLVVPFFYEDYAKKRDLLLIHLGVFLLGICPGLFLLAMPDWRHFDSLSILRAYGFWVLLAMGSLSWVVWWSFSHFIAQRKSQSRSEVLPRMALIFLPFAILSLETLFWAEYVQDDKVYLWYKVPYHRSILILLTLITSLGIGIWVRRNLGGRGPKQPFLKIFFWGVLPFLIYSLFFHPNIQRDVDFFHEGEKLVPAQAFLEGKVPYKEIFFIHGLFSDIGMPLLGFKIFGHSVEGFRILENVVSPLAVISYYYLGLLCLPFEGALLLVFLILTGLFPILATERTLMANLSLLFTVAYLKSQRTGYLCLSAFTAFLSFLIANDTGFAVILAEGGLGILLGLGRWKTERGKGWKPAFIYALTLLVSFIPFLGYLIKMKAWGPFISTYREIFGAYDHWSSLPFKTLILGIQDHYDFWEGYLLPLLILVVLILLRFKARAGQWTSPEDWILILLLLVNIVYYKRGLDRSDSGHALMGSHFGWILLLFLLTKAVRFNPRYALLYLFLVTSLFIPTPTLREGKTTLPDQLDRFATKNSIEVTGRIKISEPRLGQLFLSPEQAHTMVQVLQFFEKTTLPTEYIWDFTNQGAFYFLTDRKNPTRYALTQLVITEDQQKEVIRNLKEYPPRWIIFRSQTHWDEIDGVDTYLRHYLLSDYLLRHYKPAARIANFILLEPGTLQVLEEPYQSYLFHAVNFGYVPFLWGRDRLEEILPGHQVLKEWKFPANGKLLINQGIELETVEIDPKPVTYFIVNMKVDRGKQGHLLWATDQKGFNKQSGLVFSLRADGTFHPYVIRLSSLPAWVWVNKITRLRLDLANEGGLAEIESIQLIGKL